MDQNNKQNIFCSWCGHISYLVWVHGHGQCARCGTNIDECCKGENCNSLEKPDTKNSSKEEKKS